MLVIKSPYTPRAVSRRQPDGTWITRWQHNGREYRSLEKFYQRHPDLLRSLAIEEAQVELFE